MQTTISNLFESLCARLHVEPDRKGEVWIDCPSCGKGGKHFSFNEHTGHCFACDYSASLRAIAELLHIDDAAQNAPRPYQKPQERPARPDQWQRQPERWLDRYGAALDRVERWTRYKPVSLDSIAHFRLGVGKLPLWSERKRCWYEYRHRRLIVPVFDVNGQCAALHGRAYGEDDSGPKWLSATGSNKRVLFNARSLHSSPTVVICENYVDAILVMQREPGVVAVSGGSANWQDAWTNQIVAARPKHVLILLDNDLAGWGNPETIAALSAQWQIDHPGKKVPEPRGPKIATALLAAGVRSVRGPNWPAGTPAKWDIGSDLMRRAA